MLYFRAWPELGQLFGDVEVLDCDYSAFCRQANCDEPATAIVGCLKTDSAEPGQNRQDAG
jgi:hypothetical protein